MKYSSDDSNSLISASIIALEDELHNDEKHNNRKNKFLIIILSIILIPLMIIYVYWLKVPTKKHFLRAEYIASVDSSKKLRAEIILPFHKALDIKKNECPQLPNYDLFQISDVFIDSGTSIGVPLQKYLYDNLDSYIGNIADSVVHAYCNNNSINTDRYSEIFLFRHLDNDNYSNIINTTLNIFNPNNKYGLDHFSIYEKNCFELSDSLREDSLGLNHLGFEKSTLSVDKLKQRVKPKYLDFSINRFNNIYTSFILAPNKTANFNYKAIMPKKHESRFFQYFKMEDISQAKYSIKLRSESIQEIKLKMLYDGSIECSYTHKPFIDLNISREQSINIGDDFIEILRRHGNGDLSLDFRVQFFDMQNAQRIRLFLLTAIITLVLTSLIKLVWITVTGNGVFSGKQKKKKRNVKVTSTRKNTLGLQEEENDLPSNTPDYYLNPPGI